MPPVQAYLLVYLADASRGWRDRGDARVGSHLFFLGYDRRQLPLDPYALTAYFQVVERIPQAMAVQRYPGRPNVILDRLPVGPSQEERVRTYIAMHRDHLCWRDEDRLLEDLDAGRYVPPCGDSDLVHTHWDGHEDWARRILQPYLVADARQSKILDEPIPYGELAAACPGLPRRDSLRSAWGRHNLRRVPDAALGSLLGRVEGAPAR